MPDDYRVIVRCGRMYVRCWHRITIAGEGPPASEIVLDAKQMQVFTDRDEACTIAEACGGMVIPLETQNEALKKVFADIVEMVVRADHLSDLFRSCPPEPDDEQSTDPLVKRAKAIPDDIDTTSSRVGLGSGAPSQIANMWRDDPHANRVVEQGDDPDE